MDIDAEMDIDTEVWPDLFRHRVLRREIIDRQLSEYRERGDINIAGMGMWFFPVPKKKTKDAKDAKDVKDAKDAKEKTNDK